MEDELDQLIESAVNFGEDAPASPETNEAPDPENAIEGDAVPEYQDEGGDVTDSGETGSQDDEVPDSDPDGTPNQPDPGPRIEELQRTVDSQTNFIRTILENAKAESDAAKTQAAKEQEAREEQERLERWADMDPDVAHAEQVRFIAERADKRQQALNEQIAALENQIAASNQQAAHLAAKQEEEVAKAEVITILKDRFSLTDGEAEDMSYYPDPLTMEAFAQRAQSRRQGQTAAAREAKRQQLEGNPALRSGDTGGGAPPPPSKPAESLDDIVNSVFAFLGS